MVIWLFLVARMIGVGVGETLGVDMGVGGTLKNCVTALLRDDWTPRIDGALIVITVGCTTPGWTSGVSASGDMMPSDAYTVNPKKSELASTNNASQRMRPSYKD